MSYITLYKVPEQGQIEVYEKYQNAWWSAPVIWDALAQKHLGWQEGQWLIDGGKAIWDLVSDARLQQCEKVLLSTTLDRSMVKRVDIPKVVEAINAWNIVNRPAPNYRRMIPDLEQLAHDQECFAICWNQTSVSDAWASPRELEDEDGDLCYPRWDISVDIGHWFLEWDS